MMSMEKCLAVYQNRFMRGLLKMERIRFFASRCAATRKSTKCRQAGKKFLGKQAEDMLQPPEIQKIQNVSEYGLVRIVSVDLDRCSIEQRIE